MTTMEIEFNDEQLEKVKKLEEHDISVGDAIDMLFEVRDRVSTIIDDMDTEKIENTAAEIESKEDNSEETHTDSKKTYDEAILDVKSHVSWANDFFKL